jgi:choloylglycine hydrolase
MQKIIKTVLTLSICHLFIYESVSACTVFQLQNSDRAIVARGYDYDIDTAYAIINTKGRVKKSLLNVKETVKYLKRTLNWVSKYGSISITQNIQEVAISGMNEMGVTVDYLDLIGTIYPSPKTNTENKVISEAQLGQYILDMAKDTNEAIDLLKKLAIEKISVDIHLFICDKSKDCAVVEFLDGKMNVYKNDNLPIKALTNTSYKDSVQNYKNTINESDLISYSKFNKDERSLLRFRIAEESSKKIEQQNPIESAFKNLSRVKVNNPATEGEERREKTQWNMIYDQSNLKFYFKTTRSPSLKEIDLLNFNFECSAKVQYLNLNEGFDDLNFNYQISEDNFSPLKISDRYKILREFEKQPILLEILMPLASSITKCNK